MELQDLRCVAAADAASALSAAAPFTIEQAISAPFPSELTASPAGGKLAWVFDERGARNIWVAEAPQYRGRRLTNYRADDGQEIIDLRWSPDGRCHRLCARRRGRTARANIRIRPAIRRGRGRWCASWRSRAASRAKIGEGATPAVSRDRVYFVRAGQIMAAPLEGAEKAAQLIHARGQAEDSAPVAGRGAPGVGQRARRPFLHRRLRYRGRIAAVPGSQRGSRRGSGVVARQPAGGIRPPRGRRRASGDRTGRRCRGPCG